MNLIHYLFLTISNELLLSLSQEKVNDYVFPGTGAGGYIIEPRKQMANVTKFSGIHFTVHDLRRTFITITEGLDISAYALKRLMNHQEFPGKSEQCLDSRKKSSMPPRLA